MTALNKSAYRRALLHHRLDLAIFDESKHPRDPLTGRFRKGMNVVHVADIDPISTKFTHEMGTGKVVGVDHATGRVQVKYPAYEKPVTQGAGYIVPTSESPPDPGDVHSSVAATVWGGHDGKLIQLGEKLDGDVAHGIVQVLDRIKHDAPQVYRQLSRVQAKSEVQDGTAGRFEVGVKKMMDSNPKVVLTTKKNVMLVGHPTELFINDDRADEINSGDMRALTNPAGDKLVSPAHNFFDGLVAHEMGHVWHDGDPEVLELGEQIYKQLGQKWLREHVSWMAGQSAKEMLAEIFALKQTGHPIPEQFDALFHD